MKKRKTCEFIKTAKEDRTKTKEKDIDRRPAWVCEDSKDTGEEVNEHTQDN